MSKNKEYRKTFGLLRKTSVQKTTRPFMIKKKNKQICTNRVDFYVCVCFFFCVCVCVCVNTAEILEDLEDKKSEEEMQNGG